MLLEEDQRPIREFSHDQRVFAQIHTLGKAAGLRSGEDKEQDVEEHNQLDSCADFYLC